VEQGFSPAFTVLPDWRLYRLLKNSFLRCHPERSEGSAVCALKAKQILRTRKIGATSDDTPTSFSAACKAAMVAGFFCRPEGLLHPIHE
jgi:hypothetical protein